MLTADERPPELAVRVYVPVVLILQQAKAETPETAFRGFVVQHYCADGESKSSSRNPPTRSDTANAAVHAAGGP
ncbi:hypothetical protein AU252_15795 [Pseudarthrobacter sulfonivorans]|uniref:Uncharacterized protein n=1 Tax=Pseudarthrobacter sulfonivorans TaxID=121292 RepID=A0A0U3QDH0_9MICC|nr:hypothetical protein AU252_15795 [Pseudarthrobacter sulfonivorans]